MLTPFEFGLGGPVGFQGTQIMSWIHIDDWVRAVGKCIDDKSLTGPVNMTAPSASSTTSSKFAKALGTALHRPAIIPLPGFVLKLAFGADLVNELLLGGCGVQPARLMTAGFKFEYPELDGALKAVCYGADAANSNGTYHLQKINK
jgi:hypothetical protein